jgi:hypothetical protein
MNWNQETMFTGTLIEDLFASVERAEAAQADENAVCESLVTEGLIVLAQQSGEYDSKLVWQESGVA